MIAQMRAIGRAAQKETRKSMRDRERRVHLPAGTDTAPTLKPPGADEAGSGNGAVHAAVPFDDIEE
uniref:hypothetical protein n=1 Tax=Arthrobacter sp. TaxID=1667 RepID=UPI00159EF1FF|nr:hypothetical protein [Arthrobacter sp.]